MFVRAYARSRALLLCWIMLAAWQAPAQASGWLLASPDPRVAPGTSFDVMVIGLPDGAELPERLPAQIELSELGLRIAIELVAAGPVNAERAQRRYVGRWPTEVVGFATLSLVDAPSARMVMDAGASSRTPIQAAGAAPATVAAGSTELIAPGAAGAGAVEASALGYHEPMYFLVGGRNPTSARFQVSFRYRLLGDHGVVAEQYSAASGLYAAFTQTSLWDLQSDSKPFRDTSFRPSLFYRWRLSDPPSGAYLGVDGGYEHESNGRDNHDSRSIDTLFLRGEVRHYFADGRTYFGVAPKLWTYLDKDDNPDIARYRGHGELGLRLGRDDGLILAALLRQGTAGKSATQLDLSYPLRRSIFSGVGAFVHLQYFNGYGQTLMDYNHSTGSQLRLGISLVR